jgi:hypothetical protein
MKLQAGRLGQSATETKHANRSPVTRPVLVNYWRSLNCATIKRYIPKHINKGETKMTENEYDETFDLQMEREHQETVRRMQEFRLIGEQISKMPDTSPKVLEIEVRYLMGIIKELEARIKDLESEVRRFEMLVTRAN